MSQERKGKSGKTAKGRGQRAAWFLLPFFLIVSAALIPLMVFRIQDHIRCGKVVLGELENVDIASFNTGYEMNLYRRLLRFAEGKANGDSYYVAAQDRKPTEELTDFLSSDQGLYQTSFLTWIDNGAIPTEVLEYDIQKWTQYVIYGEDFSAGVNFMLWYIELSDPGAPTLKLLMDAETGDIYGISYRKTEETLAEGESVHSVSEKSWTEMEGFRGEAEVYEMSRLWYLMACRYGGLEDAAVEKILQENDYLHMEFTENEGFTENESVVIHQETRDRYAELIDAFTDYEIRGILYQLGQMRWEISEDGKTHTYFFLYGPESGEVSYELPFSCRIDGIMLVLDAKKYLKASLGELLLGFPDIYELIPEFTESEE